MPSLRPLLAAFGAVAIVNTLVASANEQQQAPLTGDDYVCEHPPYNVLLVSKSPLVIYLQNFITPLERAHLLDLGLVKVPLASALPSSSPLPLLSPSSLIPAPDILLRPSCCN